MATFDRVSELLGTGNSAFVGPVVQVLAAMLSLFEISEPDVVVYEWRSSGCLEDATCRRSTTELVTVAASLQPRAVGIISSAVDETETVDVDLLDQIDDELLLNTVSFNVACFNSPEALIRLLDTADYIDKPEIAISIALERILPAGMNRPNFQVLSTLAPSLKQLTPALRRSAIGAMAAALLPIEVRPSGIEEHPLRTGEGGNDPQVTSVWGKAVRATVSKRGPGWRVHYWRGVGVVTFSNVCMHASLEIHQ